MKGTKKIRRKKDYIREQYDMMKKAKITEMIIEPSGYEIMTHFIVVGDKLSRTKIQEIITKAFENYEEIHNFRAIVRQGPDMRNPFMRALASYESYHNELMEFVRQPQKETMRKFGKIMVNDEERKAHLTGALCEEEAHSLIETPTEEEKKPSLWMVISRFMVGLFSKGIIAYEQRKQNHLIEKQNRLMEQLVEEVFSENNEQEKLK